MDNQEYLLWNIEYETPPLRAIGYTNAMAIDESDARRIFKKIHPISKIRNIEVSTKQGGQLHD